MQIKSENNFYYLCKTSGWKRIQNIFLNGNKPLEIAVFHLLFRGFFIDSKLCTT